MHQMGGMGMGAGGMGQAMQQQQPASQQQQHQQPGSLQQQQNNNDRPGMRRGGRGDGVKSRLVASP